MPIFKISKSLKSADRDVNDKSAICTNCEYGSEPGNPVVNLGKKDGITIWAHRNCPSTMQKQREAEEMASRVDRASIFAFADKFRYIASNMPENSTVEETFPTAPKNKHEVKDMTRMNASEEYSDDNTGAPVPPSM